MKRRFLSLIKSLLLPLISRTECPPLKINEKMKFYLQGRPNSLSQ